MTKQLAPAQARRILLAVIVVLLLLIAAVYVFPPTPRSGDFAVRVRGRIELQGSDGPPPGVWVMAAPSRERAMSPDRICGVRVFGPWGRPEIDRYQAEQDRRMERGESPLPPFFAPMVVGGGEADDAGAFQFVVVVPWTWDEWLGIPLKSREPPPRHAIRALRVEVEGRSPVVLDIEAGAWTEHEPDEVCWATYDLGTVVVPVGESKTMTSGDSGESEPWPFQDSPRTAVITVHQVINGSAPVLLVTHDAGDGTWQFLAGGSLSAEDAMVVGLEEIVSRDGSLRELSDLPRGWRAWREEIGHPWHREKSED